MITNNFISFQSNAFTRILYRTDVLFAPTTISSVARVWQTAPTPEVKVMKEHIIVLQKYYFYSEI